MYVCMLGGGGLYVCVTWTDKGCEGRYVAFSF